MGEAIRILLKVALQQHSLTTWLSVCMLTRLGEKSTKPHRKKELGQILGEEQRYAPVMVLQQRSPTTWLSVCPTTRLSFCMFSRHGQKSTLLGRNKALGEILYE